MSLQQKKMPQGNPWENWVKAGDRQGWNPDDDYERQMKFSLLAAQAAKEREQARLLESQVEENKIRQTPSWSGGGYGVGAGAGAGAQGRERYLFHMFGKG